MAKQESSKFGTKQPSNTESISPVLGAALFGDSGIQDPNKLSSEAKKAGSISENLSSLVTGNISILDAIRDNGTEIVELKESFGEFKTGFETQFNDFKEYIKKENDTLLAGIGSYLTELPTRFGVLFADTPIKIDISSSDSFVELISINNSIKDKLAEVVTTLDNLRKTQDKGGDDGKSVQGVLKIIIEGINKGDIKAIKDLAEVKLTKESILSIEAIDSLADYYKKLDEVFKLQVAAGKSAQAAQKANAAIKKNIEASEDVAISANESVDDIKAGQISFAELGSFIVKAGIVLMLGALFMMIPGMLKNALKFTVALTAFIAGILIPIIIVQAIGGKTKGTIVSLDGLGSVVFRLGILLMLGGLFMMIPGIFKNAMQFTIAMSIFLTAILIPIAIASKLAGGNTLDNLDEIKSIIITSAIIMSIGALFVMFGGGKYVMAALKFGVILAAFLLCILTPIMVYGALAKKEAATLQGIQSLVVSCSIIMMLGALFVTLGGGKYIINSLVFGLILGVFIMLVLTPLIVYGMLVRKEHKTVKGVQRLIVASTIIMMLGALFTMNQKLVIHALLFGLLLMAFITAVLAPILVFSILQKRALKSVKWIVGLIVVCTMVMLIGAYFVQNRDFIVNALLFTLLLDAFLWGVLLPIVAVQKIARGSAKVMLAVALLIAVAAGVLYLGAWVFETYGWTPVLFAAVLVAFLYGVTAIMKIVAKNAKLYLVASKAMLLLASSITMISGAIALMAFIGDTYGWDSILYGVVTLAAIVGMLCMALKIASKNLKDITKGNLAFIEIAAGVTVMSLALGIIVGLGVSFGWDNVLIGAVTLLAVSGIFAVLYLILAAAKSVIDQGALVMLSIAGSIAIMAIALGIIAFIGEKFGWGAVVGGVITLVVVAITFGLLYAALTFAAPYVAPGALVMIAIAGSLLIMTVAIGLVAFIGDTFGWGAVIGGVLALVVIAITFSILYSALMAAAAPVAGGAVVIVAIGASLLIMSAAIGLIAFIGTEYGWDAVIGGVIVLVAVATILGVLYSVIAAAAAPVAIGAVVLIAIAGGLGLLTLVIWGIVALIDAYGENKITNAPWVLAEFFGKMIVTFLAAGACGVSAIIGLIGIALMTPAVLGIAALVTAMGKALQSYRKAVEGREGIIDEIRGSISSFIGISDAAPGLFAFIKIRKKLGRVSSLVFYISSIVRILAAAIKSFADLRIPTKWNEEGEPIKYRQLGLKDFQAAADGVAYTMTTLASAITTTYDNNPKLFGDNAWWILRKVRELAITQGFILSILCHSLQSYANLLIPTKWDKEGKAIKFRTMKQEDFINAANGIYTVMTTLAKAITDTYTNNPDLFGSKGWWIMRRVRDLAFTQGFILHTLSLGLQSYARILIPMDWNDEGVAIKFRQMTPKEFQDAATNIAAVMTILAYAIHSVFEGGEYTIQTASGAVTVGTKGEGLGWFAKYTLPRATRALVPLGALISSIAQGLQSYASLVVPIDWDPKTGNPTKFKQMPDEMFGQAARNIEKIILTLAYAIDDAYWALPGSSDYIKKTIEAFVPMGELVSSISSGLQSYANLKIPIKWNAKGQAIKFQNVNEGKYTYYTIWRAGKYYGTWKGSGNFFEAAGENVKTVLLLLSYAVNSAYWSLPGDSDYIKKTIEAFVPMGDLVSSLAEGLQAYANLNVPIYGRNGKIVGRRQMSGAEITMAGYNIGGIMTLLARTIGAVWDGEEKTVTFGSFTYNYKTTGLKDMMDADDFKEIIEAFGSIGDLIKNIAEGIQSYANLSIPIFGSKGEIKSRKQMSEDDFKNAGLNITKVITGMLFGDADLEKTDAEDIKTGIIGAYNILSELDIEDEIETIIQSFKPVGELISSTADGLAKYASLNVPVAWGPDGKPTKYRKMSDTMFAAAGENIVKVLMTTLFGEESPQNSSTVQSGVIGAYNILSEIGIQDKTKEIIESFKPVGELLESMCKGISGFANLMIPDQWDKDGKPIHYMKLSSNDFKQATKNINDVCITLIGSLVAVVDRNPDYFSEGADVQFKTVIDSVKGVGDIIKNIADGVNTFAKGGFPIYDKEGKIVGYDKLTPQDYANMTANIQYVMLSMVCAVINAGRIIEHYSSSEEFTTAVDNVSKIGGLLKTMAEGVQAWADMKIPTGWYADGSAKGYRKLRDTDLTNAKDNIISIVVTLANALASVYGTKLENNQTFIEFAGSDTISTISQVTRDSLDVIKNAAEIVTNLSSLRVPTGWYSDGTAKGYEKLDKGKIEVMSKVLNELLTIIPKTISEVYVTNPKIYSNEFIEHITEMSSVIESVNSITSTLMSLLKTFNENEQDINKIFATTAFKQSTQASEKLTIGMFANLYTVFEQTGLIYQLLTQGGAETEKKWFGETAKSISGKWVTLINDMSTIISTLCYSLISTIVEESENIKKIFDDNAGVKSKVTATRGLITMPTITVLNNICQIIFDLNTMAVALMLSQHTNIDIKVIKSFIKNIGSIIECLVSNVVYTIIDASEDIKAVFNDPGIIGPDNYSVKLIGLINNIYKDIVELGTYIGQQKQNFNVINSCIYMKDMSTIIDILTNYIVRPILDCSTELLTINSLKGSDGDLNIPIFNTIRYIVNDTNKLMELLSDKGGFGIKNWFKGIKIDNLTKRLGQFKIMFALLSDTILLPIYKYIKIISSLYSYSKLNTETALTYKIGIFGDIHCLITDIGELLKNVSKDTTVIDYRPLLSNLHGFNLMLLQEFGFIHFIIRTSDAVNHIYGITKHELNNAGTIKFNVGAISNLYGILIDVFGILDFLNNATKHNIYIYADQLDVLARGFDAVFEALNKHEYQEQLSKTTEQIDKFIKNTVNQIDVEKIDRLISLTASLNNLADKTTNLDELTKAIAEDLTVALDELVKRMDESKEVIRLSEEIQNKRHLVINKVIGEMKSMMSKPIDVIISVKDNEGNSSSSSSSSGNDSSSSNTSSSGTASAPEASKIGGGSGSLGGASTDKSTDTPMRKGDKSVTRVGGNSGSSSTTDVSSELNALSAKIDNLIKAINNKRGGLYE